VRKFCFFVSFNLNRHKEVLVQHKIKRLSRRNYCSSVWCTEITEISKGKSQEWAIRRGVILMRFEEPGHSVTLQPCKHSPDSTLDRNSSKQSWIISLEIMKMKCYDFSKLCSNGARSPNTWPWATENIFTWIFQVNILSHEPEFFRFMRQLLKLSSNARIISSFDFKHRTSYNTSLIRKYILGRPAGWSAGVGFLIYSKKAKRKCCWIRCTLIFKGSSTWIHL